MIRKACLVSFLRASTAVHPNILVRRTSISPYDSPSICVCVGLTLLSAMIYLPNSVLSTFASYSHFCLIAFFCFVCLFCFVLFCFVSFRFISFRFVSFRFVLFCFVLCCVALRCVACSVLFCSVLFCFVLFCFVCWRLLFYLLVCYFVCMYVRVRNFFKMIKNPSPPFGERWRLYILPQCLSNLTKLIATRKKLYFWEVSSYPHNFVCPEFEPSKTVLDVLEFH